MANTIQHRRGDRGDREELPRLEVGEIGFLKDTGEAFIGGPAGNIPFLTLLKAVGGRLGIDTAVTSGSRNLITSGAVQEAIAKVEKQEGPRGEKGEPGFSPQVGITKEGSVTTITITDADGVHSARIEQPDIYVLAWTHKWNTKPAGEWSFSVYKNGVLCETSLYAEIFWTNSANAYPKTLAGATGEFTGTKTWSANSALRYLVNIYEDSTTAKLLASAFLSPG